MNSFTNQQSVPMDITPVRRPPSVRTCPGCELIFSRRKYRDHVRNACGEMISVSKLRDAIQRAANRSGEESIPYFELAIMVEVLAVDRASALDVGLAENEDMVVEVNGHLTSLVAYRDSSRARLAHHREERSNRGVDLLTQAVTDMQL